MSATEASDNDTIAAIATAPGRGGVGIVRLSGSQALRIGETICEQSLTNRHAHYTRFNHPDKGAVDTGLGLYFHAPHSFTGEHVVELQGHGGPVVMDLLLSACIRLGARLARPGEFSERAYLNGRMDLAQAEAVADLINSTTEQAALNANRSLSGAFSDAIQRLVEAVTHLRVYVEAAIDFPEEEIDFVTDGEVASQLQNLITQLDEVFEHARQGSLVQEGMKLVIVGKPNAGKSSLLNALAGQDSAIVTDIAGTTRDVLREHVQLDGLPLHIVDTAGLRDAGDAVEKEGIRRALAELDSADRILLVVDGTEPGIIHAGYDDLWPTKDHTFDREKVTVVFNKCDISELRAGFAEDSHRINLSARTGEGLDVLRDHLKQCMGYTENTEGVFSARRRHLDALTRAQESLQNGQAQLLGAGAGELLAEDLRQCQQHLGDITGQLSSDDLLGEIFSSFCIGK